LLPLFVYAAKQARVKVSVALHRQEAKANCKSEYIFTNRSDDLELSAADFTLMQINLATILIPIIGMAP
jgi:hypothetical protein